MKKIFGGTRRWAVLIGFIAPFIFLGRTSDMGLMPIFGAGIGLWIGNYLVGDNIASCKWCSKEFKMGIFGGNYCSPKCKHEHDRQRK